MAAVSATVASVGAEAGRAGREVELHEASMARLDATIQRRRPAESDPQRLAVILRDALMVFLPAVRSAASPARSRTSCCGTAVPTTAA